MTDTRTIKLPPAVTTQTDWPWIVETWPSSNLMPNDRSWPKLSVITPSYNQGEFLEETIRSVLLQGYPDIEYIIIDGGSTDESVEIIHKYEPWLSYWVSEPDRGQAHAINKGFARASGEIVAWINSDDTYEPGALARAAAALCQNPDAAFVYSDCYFTDVKGTLLHLATSHPTDRDEMLLGNVIAQPTVFYRAQVLRSVGFLSEEFRYVMDFDLWLRILGNRRAVYTPGVTARFRLQSGSKSVSQEHAAWAELIQLLEAQKEQAAGNAQVRKAVGLACLMAGWAYVNDGAQVPMAAKFFRRARDLGLFSRRNLPLAAKRSQAILNLKECVGSSRLTLEQLMELGPDMGLPKSFWNYISAFNEIERADTNLKQKQWDQLRTRIVRALRLAPSLIFEKSTWPLILGGLLGPRWLYAAIRAKQARQATARTRPTD